MDPGCKQHSQLDKIFWSLTNNTRHVRSELIHVSSVSGLSSSAEAGVCLGWRTQATPSLFLCLIQVKQQVLNCCLDSHVDVFASPRLTVSSRDTVQRWVKAELQPLHHLSNFWQRMHITRGERNYTDKEKQNQYVDRWKWTGGVFVLNVPLLKMAIVHLLDRKGKNTFQLQSFKHQYTIYSPILLGQKCFNNRSNCFCATVRKGQRLNDLPEHHIWAAGCSLLPTTIQSDS